MILWTIQTVSRYEELLQTGILRGREETLQDPDDGFFFRWMADQQKTRTKAEGVTSPVWAWYAYRGRSRRKPDLRCGWHLPTGAPGVRVEMSCPPEHVLLSQFEMWTHVLNGRFVPHGEGDMEPVRLQEATGAARRRIIESWNHIFDMEYGCCDFWGPLEERAIQATLPYILRDWVVAERHFIAR